MEVVLDRTDNANIGQTVGRFIDQIPKVNFIVVVGTPLYLEKYENKLSKTGSVVAAEVDLIYLRLVATEAEKETVLPLLLAGDKNSSLPPLMRRLYANFTDGTQYHPQLLNLLRTLWCIPVDDEFERLMGELKKVSADSGSKVS